MFNKRTYDFQPKRACSIITIGSFKKQQTPAAAVIKMPFPRRGVCWITPPHTAANDTSLATIPLKKKKEVNCNYCCTRHRHNPLTHVLRVWRRAPPACSDQLSNLHLVASFYLQGWRMWVISMCKIESQKMGEEKRKESGRRDQSLLISPGSVASRGAIDLEIAMGLLPIEPL